MIKLLGRAIILFLAAVTSLANSQESSNSLIDPSCPDRTEFDRGWMELSSPEYLEQEVLEAVDELVSSQQFVNYPGARSIKKERIRISIKP